VEFFATSHGKSACDGIGGTVKRLLTKASLQRPYNDAILTTEAIMSFCKCNVSGIKFFNVKPERYEACKEKLTPRFQMANTIKGTLKFHRFIPLSNSKLLAYKLSAQTNPPQTVSVTKEKVKEINGPNEQMKINKQAYVCCRYDGKPWIGMIEDTSQEFGDVFINFLHPHCPANIFYWPSCADKCWVDLETIICGIETPSMVTSGRCRYTISEHDKINIAQKCKNWV